ncbi:TEL2 [Candida margitis]|uniref:TEL2 n=1 Tax=Candida margitis TaxID=1775924 RepID=UPI0022264D74|nr:TEL2 [Candida margitis]KAI5970805.1 TEL2 [Candida margitis]
MNNDIDLLKNYPSILQLDEILDKYDYPPFSVVSALLNFTVPQIYSSLPKTTETKLICKFQTLIGFGNLLGRVSSLLAEPNNDNELKLYFNLLQSVVDEQLVPAMALNRKSPELREVDKLVFKGKLLAVVNEVSSSKGWDVENKALKTSKSYGTYLSKSVLHLYRQNQQPDIFVHSILSTESFSEFFKIFFAYDNWGYFRHTLERLKSFQRKGYIKRLMITYVVNIVNDANIVPLHNILQFTCECIDENLIESVVLRSNKSLIQLVASIISSSKDRGREVIKSQLQRWSDPTYIKNEPITIQESRTFFILQLIARVDDGEFLKGLTRNKICLEGISNRLQSFSNNVRSLGVILADRIFELSGEQQIFKSANIGHEFDELLAPMVPLVNMSDADSWESLEQDKNQLPATKPVIKTPVIPTDTSVNEISEDEDEEDASLQPKVKIPDPIYVKDLISYITVDTKNPQAYEMRRVALIKGPTLLHRKFRHGNEVEFYSQDLLTNLVALENFYNDPDFDDLKLVNMVSVITTNPNVTFYMFDLLLTGDYSLQQRMFILSATSLAARELRGIKDDVVVKSFTKESFPTKQLPSSLHNKYMGQGGTKYLDQIGNELQDSLMHQASSDAQDQVIGKGKLVRISRSLTRPKDAQTSEKPIIPNFYKIIGANFYFPMLNVWYESGSIDIGHYSPVFIAHYIKTLSLLLHVAYPSSTQLKEMIKEFLLLSCTVIRKVTSEEVQVIESILTGILLILELIDAEFLVLNFNDEVMLVYNWLTVTWEGIIDNRIKSLAAGLLLKLQEVSKKFERTLIDQNYGLY